MDDLQALLAEYERDKYEPRWWRLLAAAYEQRGEFARAAFFRGLLCKHAGELPAALSLTPEGREQFALGLTDPRFAAFRTQVDVDGDGNLTTALTGNLMRFIASAAPRDDGCRLYAGLHSDNGVRNYLGLFARQCQGDAALAKELARHVSQDIIPGRELRALRVEPPPGRALVLPLAGTSAVNQAAEFRTATFAARSTLSLRLGAWSFYRLDEPTRISSEAPMIVGQPMLLGHSPRRRKVVLNLLIDALPWSIVRARGCVDVPNLMRYFGDGVIFDRCWSMAEYTYPSLATIETGRTMQQVQVVCPEVMVSLSPRWRTLAERMSEAGYLCTCVATDGSNVYNGVLRGYDRVLANVYTTPAHEGVERVIRQLEAFSECDQFILMHTSDVHPANWESEFSLEAQVKTPLADNVLNGTQNVSVSLPPTAMNRYQNLQAIRMADNALGRLFEYLGARYRDDELAVCLYSDHGVSVHDDDPWMMSESRTRTAFMVRGGGVPRRGLVEEPVSSVDIYATTLHNARLAPEPGVYAQLPRVLGGAREREFVVSNSIYPGQTFKLAVRDARHEWRLESAAFTQANGHVDLGRHSSSNFADRALTARFAAAARQYLAENNQSV